MGNRIPGRTSVRIYERATRIPGIAKSKPKYERRFMNI